MLYQIFTQPLKKVSFYLSGSIWFWNYRSGSHLKKKHLETSCAYVVQLHSQEIVTIVDNFR